MRRILIKVGADSPHSFGYELFSDDTAISSARTCVTLRAALHFIWTFSGINVKKKKHPKNDQP